MQVIRERLAPEERRAQIVAAAIETVAELGYAQTSFAKIAKRAGISSTRLISYHFAGKDDLMRAVVTDIVTSANEFMGPRIEAQTDYGARLEAYIRSNLEYLRDYPRRLRALLEIGANARNSAGEPVVEEIYAPPAIATLTDGFREAQRAGACGDFDPHVMAVALRAAIDAVARRHAAGVEPDIDAVATQLVTLFSRATQVVRNPLEPKP